MSLWFKKFTVLAPSPYQKTISPFKIESVIMSCGFKKMTVLVPGPYQNTIFYPLKLN